MDNNAIKLVKEMRENLDEAILHYTTFLNKLKRYGLLDVKLEEATYLRPNHFCWKQFAEERTILKLSIKGVQSGEFSAEKAEEILTETLEELKEARQLIHA